MENLTLGQLAADLGIIVAILGGFGLLYTKLKGALEKIITEQLKPISDQLNKVDTETTKNFLVRCIADIERGDEMSETEKERFYEQYEHYVSLGGNTYIKAKVEKLIAEGKL